MVSIVRRETQNGQKSQKGHQWRALIPGVKLFQHNFFCLFLLILLEKSNYIRTCFFMHKRFMYMDLVYVKILRD